LLRGTAGSLEGAGGIGGLLARSHGYSSGSWSIHNFYHADGLGNVTFMVSTAQAMVASYRYHPYGRAGLTATDKGISGGSGVYDCEEEPGGYRLLNYHEIVAHSAYRLEFSYHCRWC